VRRITAAAVVLLLAAGCASGDDGSGATSTTQSATTLPPPSTTTTLPPRSVTEVDVCGLLHEDDLAPVLDDAGVGEPGPLEERDPDAGVPAFVTAECSWPSRDDPALILSYLAPTTAADGPQHLEDVLATDSGFAEGGQVLSQEVGAQTVGILLDEHQRVRELAVVKRSALLYLLVEQEADARDEAALTAYATLLTTALRRAPR
jgi:hypothetical protein